MEREIKFRGKNRLGGWSYGMPLLFDTNKDKEEVRLLSRYIAEDGMEHVADWIVKTKTIGRYTGLKDKNGREIYEGDIISNEDCVLGYIVFSMRYGISIQRKNTSWSLRNFCFDSDLDVGILDNMEVVGNIHDNPELIK